MDISFEETNRDLLHFISKSPSVFHVVRHIKAALLYAGFTEIREEDSWQIKRGGKYVVTRNGSALIAFSVPEDGGNAFKITAAHCDSPTFKIKENPEMRDGKYTRLNVEGYGGMIMSTWLDRPLSAAGRLFVKDNGQIISKLVSLGHPTLLIPSVAIHMDRTINSGHAWNIQNDLLPLYSTDGSADFMETLAQAAKVKAADILGHDIFLYSCSPGILWGRSTNLSHRPALMICNVLLPHSADLPTAKNKKTFPSMPSLITRKWAAEPPRVQALHSLQILFPALLFLWAEATMKYRPCLPKVS